VTLYMHQLGFIRSFLPSTPSRRVGPCGLHVSFEWDSSLVDSGYAKSEDLMGRVLVTRCQEISDNVV
jgi:hypothetical protein